MLATWGSSSGVAAPVTDPNIQSVNVEAWSTTYIPQPVAVPPALGFDPIANPKYLVLNSAGFDATCTAITRTRVLVQTASTRQAFPQQALQNVANRCALNDPAYLSPDDVPVPATIPNNSTVRSPVPIVNWAMPRVCLVVGNFVFLEFVAIHRNAGGGQQIAGAKLFATDGVLTVSATVGAAAKSNRPGDRCTVLTYSAVLDISTLAAGFIKCDGEAYPRFGSGPSVRKSTAGTTPRQFSSYYVFKNVARATNPPIACVSTTGSNVTGIWSNSYAASALLPFATLDAANDAIMQAGFAGITGGDSSGCIVYLGTNGGGTFAAPHAFPPTLGYIQQNSGALIYRPDPNEVASTCILDMTANGFRAFISNNGAGPNATTNEFYIYVDGLRVSRSGGNQITGEGFSTLYNFNNLAGLDLNNDNSTWLNGNASDGFYGAGTITGMTNGFMGAQDSTGIEKQQHRCWRGLFYRGVLTSPEEWLTLGCDISAIGTYAAGLNMTVSGGIRCFNKFFALGDGTQNLAIGATIFVGQFAFCQNVAEYIGVANQTSIWVSGDGATGDNSHVCMFNNTVVGYWIYGRNNNFYCETGNTSSLGAVAGNIFTSFNIKGDVFEANGAFVNNWFYLYGVGMRANYMLFIDASSGGQGSSFALAYPGLQSVLGTSNLAPAAPLASIFVNFQATTNNGVNTNPIAGAGFGDYHLAPGSPCAGMLKDPVFNFDIDGNPRPATNDSAGAYAA